MAFIVLGKRDALKLVTAAPGQVVRNANNGSHYRFEGRLEHGKARIFPLELFPNGLLIAKPTPTTVEGDIEVIVVGIWTEDLVVEGKPDKSRRVYEKELLRLEGELPELERQYEELPRSGTGKSSRGSHANKVKNVRMRIATLKRGLGFVDSSQMVHTAVETSELAYECDDLVQVPSGRIAKVTGFQPMGDQTYVQVITLFSGAAVRAALPCEVLRPAHEARLCTI